MEETMNAPLPMTRALGPEDIPAGAHLVELKLSVDQTVALRAMLLAEIRMGEKHKKRKRLKGERAASVDLYLAKLRAALATIEAALNSTLAPIIKN